jgi:hypothetical protein
MKHLMFELIRAIPKVATQLKRIHDKEGMTRYAKSAFEERDALLV